jgi:hypothetical protein
MESEMPQEQKTGAAKDVLTLVLSFFSRVDAKASVVLAVDTGMLGYLAAHLSPLNSMRWWDILAPALALVLLTISYWHLYKGAFPNLEGGDRSLVYFREIAKRTENKFIDEFVAQQESDYAKDLLGQAWRNSVILKEKFNHLKLSFSFMAAAIFPWAITLILGRLH